ncbi:MAG: hypothetical protein ACLFTT_14310 [Candidatus Hydrogenedentota bacterium]
MKKNCLFVVFLLVALPRAAQEPALPTGLGGEDAQQTTSEEPALPSGLGGEAQPSPEEPGLPEGLGGDEEATDTAAEDEDQSWREKLPFPLSGFFETRGALRLQDDPAQSKSAVLGESRVQLESEHYLGDAFVFDWRADFFLDAVREQGDFDMRKARLQVSPLESLDISIGRQILTWGTGDLLFLNDLFPKDWRSFLSGREVEYLKAPSDALKLGWYNDLINLELVYTPQFDHDRLITGERISWYDPMTARFRGADDDLDYNAPSDWFSHDEWALRAYRHAGDWELAAYGYTGYWKSPGGQTLMPPFQAIFPRLDAYGASARGTLGPGIFNAEVSYYHSRDDTSGDDPGINNSEFRALVGYEQELAKDFTGATQLYLEHMMDHGAYTSSLPPGLPAREQNRLVWTLRLTKLLLQQNLTLSWFSFYSPTDQDAFLRPAATYKITDHWTVEGGMNIFLGKEDHTFFGQFENNTAAYFGARYSF